MAKTLKEIRESILLDAANKHTATKSFYGDGVQYPHWNIDVGQTAKLRFIPDSNPTNQFFWVEKQMIKLRFSGIKGDVNSKPAVVQVPCIEMFDGYAMKCPITNELRKWYKSKRDDEAQPYWKKKSYLFQGFVRENPLVEDDTDANENKIRKFTISPQIFNIIKSGLMDTEIEDIPTDFERGLDFSVRKTLKGDYSDYSTCSYSRKTSAITKEEREAVEKGYPSLSSLLPAIPDQEHLDIMYEMFEASANGESYDTDRWGKFYKPWDAEESNEKVTASISNLKEKVSDKDKHAKSLALISAIKNKKS